jgi:PAS domain S-box-containing protein
MTGPAVIMLDRGGRVAAWNEGAELVYGYAAPEVIGEHLGIFYADDDIAKAEEDLDVAAREGAYEAERSRLRADGTRFRASVKIMAQRDGRGSVLGFTDVVGDLVGAEDDARESRFLAEAGRILSSSLDYRETLSKVARLVVPRLADWCVVDVLEGDGSITNVATAHREPEKIALARRWRELYPPDPDARRGTPQVLRTGRPELIPEIPAALLEESARDEEHREMLRSLDLASYMVVPLAARGRMLGTISLAAESSGRRFGPADLELAEDLAARAALAVDNARHYEEAQKEISIRERAEGELKRAEARYRALVEQMPAVTYIEALDTEGRATDIAYASPQIRDLFGYTAEEWMSDPDLFVRLLHPDDRERVLAEDERTERTGEPFREEYRQYTRDGRIVWVRDEATLVRDDEGRPLYWQGVILDVTERKRAEEALRHSEERYRTVIERAAEGIYLVDAETGRVLDVNPAFCELLGYAHEEVIGMPLYDLLDHDPAEIDRNIEATAVGASRDVGERRYRRRDGSLLHAVSNGSAMIHEGRKVISILMHDVTERKQAEMRLEALVEELRRSNAELEQFAYVASHDLQEPLRMVSSFTQLLQRRYEGRLDETADEFIGYAVDGATRMQALINALLEYSRVGTRGGPFAAVDTQRVLDAAVANLRNAVEESGAEVAFDGLPAVLGDEVQLMQLFQNLVANAIKFRGEERPLVRVEARRQGGAWLFSVEDNGIGIPAEYRERIFVIFQRLHGREEYSGTGIGLALCKKIVERHGGKIRVESEPGRGSTFYFTLRASR